MDNSHLYIMIIVLSIFAILGNIFGIIIHSKAPQYIKNEEIVKNCYIGLIVCFVFVLLFVAIYATWHILHHHKSIKQTYQSRSSPKAYRQVNKMMPHSTRFSPQINHRSM